MNLKQKLTPMTSFTKKIKKSLFVLALAVPVIAPVNLPAEILNLGSKPTVLMKSNAPRSGMSMNRVLSKFGKPAKRISAPGRVTTRNPLITKWYYGKTVVYFENKHVIHTVVRP